MSVDESLGADHHQVHARRCACHVFSDYSLDRSLESGFVLRVVGRAEAVAGVRLNRGLSLQWNGYDRANKRPAISAATTRSGMVKHFRLILSSCV